MTGGNLVRVMIVDDHQVVRSGIRFSLLAFDDLELVAEAESGEEALRWCSQASGSAVMPDVILMDMLMPGIGTGTLVHDALQAGAIGYLLKDAAIDQLAEAIRAAHAGRATLAVAAARALAETTLEPPEPGHNLTDREREVLALVVEGLSNLQIAHQLGISLSTVRFHVSTILSKLGAANRAEAAALAVKYRLVP
jgi:NarL family two-component system response regulator LiaR